tara:strand:+ start:181 stop:708 length:528 start_codon:yes stop_codon:yes gene_type:complete
MQYFKEFPKIIYDITGRGDFKLITDLLRRVKVRDGIKSNISLFDKYDVKDGESPEIVSERFYGTQDFWWVVLLMNNIKDRYYDWPLSVVQFQNYMTSKYDNADAIRHYEIVQTSGPDHIQDNSHLIEVNSTQPGATSVSYREYEDRLQDKKRQIKILDKQYLNGFVDEFLELIKK